MKTTSKIWLSCGIVMLICSVVMFIFDHHKLVPTCYGIAGVLFIIAAITHYRKNKK